MPLVMIRSILCAHIQSSPYRNEQCVRPVWCDLEVVRSALVRAFTGLYFLLFVTERVVRDAKRAVRPTR